MIQLQNRWAQHLLRCLDKGRYPIDDNDAVHAMLHQALNSFLDNLPYHNLPAAPN